jgi:hypothetical protein
VNLKTPNREAAKCLMEGYVKALELPDVSADFRDAIARQHDQLADLYVLPRLERKAKLYVLAGVGASDSEG